MIEILLMGKHSQGRVTKVSDEDYEFLSQWSWRVYKYQKGYELVSRFEKRNDRQVIISMAKEVLTRKLGHSFASSGRVDHANRDTFDNRRENLRLVSNSENRMNSRLNRNSTSGYKGVSYHKFKGKWQAYISLHQKRKHLGHFIAKEEAARAYDRAAIEMFGEFAVLNFPRNQ